MQLSNLNPVFSSSHCLDGLIPRLIKYVEIYYCSRNIYGCITLLELKIVKAEFSVKLEFQELKFFEKIASKFTMLLFMKLELHKKLVTILHKTQILGIQVTQETLISQTQILKI